METIAFYISNHGLGHVTRCLALIEQILQTTTNNIYIAGGKNQNQFAKRYIDKYLSKYAHRLTYNNIKTDVGLIRQKNSISVDVEKLEVELEKYIDNLPNLIDKETAILREKNPKLIISDISILGILVADKLNIRKIGISNFTWYNHYKNFNISPKILQVFYDAYNKLDYFLAYDLTLDLSYLKCDIEKVGLVSRKIDYKSVNEIKKHYWPCVYVSSGLSAKLKETKIHFDEGKIFSTKGVEITSNASVHQLSLNILDTQNHVAASELVVIKAGWATLSEALISKTPIVVIDGVEEDEPIINILKEQNLCVTIKEEELNNLDILDLQIKIQGLKTSKYKNNVEKVVNKICEYIEEAEHKFCCIS